MIASKKIPMLLVSQTINDEWINRFQDCLDQFGNVDVIVKNQVFKILDRSQYEIVFLDENIITDEYDLIRNLMFLQPSVRVIVVADATDWRRARKAFQYGAYDYISTLTKPEDLANIVTEL